MIDSALKKLNILVVDDEEANVIMLEDLLTYGGYENIRTTTDSRKVLDIFASFQPDLILLDLMMPYLTGFEVMDQLKTIHSGNIMVPILVLTADVTQETKMKALSGGASDFLTKPLDLIEVELRIKNLLTSRYFQKELNKQNEILEEKVKERTADIVEKNKELVIAKEKAEASDKLKTNFINIISHEIRTPLNGILGFCQILTDEDLSDEEKKEYMGLLSESTDRLINIITNFIDISLLNSGFYKKEIKETYLSGIIDNVVSKYRRVITFKSLKIIVNNNNISKNIKIASDPEIISKILNHLFDNSVKFTSKGFIRIDYLLKDNNIHINITDTGIGIADEFKDKIYDHFLQENIESTRDYEGSGLGLAIVSRFIKLLEGNIWFESKKGEGTVFHIVVPNVKLTDDEGPDELSERKDKYKILIAEDDDINYNFLAIILKHDNIIITRAINGIEAVDYCKKNADVDLVLMDLKMSKMDGFEAITQIRPFFPSLPIIVLTAYAGNEEKQRAIECGCNDYMVKPLKAEVLFNKLEKFGISVSNP